MKWGRKKSSSLPSLTRPSSISRVFPISWLSKFNHRNGSSQLKPAAKTNQKGKQKSAFPNSPQRACWREGRFYGGDDDSYWRLSFGGERFEGEQSRGGLKSVWYDSDDEIDVPMSSSRSFKSRATLVAGGEENQKFSDMVSDIRKLREMSQNVEILPGNDECKGGKGSAEAELKTARRKVLKDKKSGKMNRSVEEKRAESERKSVETDICEIKRGRIIQTNEKDYQKSPAFDQRRQHNLSLLNSNLRAIEEDLFFEALKLDEANAFSEEELSRELQKSKDMKIRDPMLKNEKQRKSIHVSRESQKRTKKGSKIRVYSPRTVTKIECKIKALEDMKKAKKKMKNNTALKSVEDRTAFDSFAVVKSSFDPQQDFKDSMVEMIIDKGIRQPEELEELLACYLTLNCDEYHDLIIKVFRQVWFELNQVYDFGG